MLHKERSIATDFKSSFLSCEKDQKLILDKLFQENEPYSSILKKLLVVNTEDCLDDTIPEYRREVENMNVSDLIEGGYILRVPKIALKEHDQVKSYILLEFSDFTPSINPRYRNVNVSITIISHLDYWELENFKLRPYQIAGYIDGILDNTKLSGIGTFQFLGATEVILNEYLGGIVLNYMATHNLEEDRNNQMPNRG